MNAGASRLPAGDAFAAVGSAASGLDPALAGGDRFGSEERPRLAIGRIVRGAWLLDLHGDAGDRTRVEEAYRIFAEGRGGLGIGSGGGR